MNFTDHFGPQAGAYQSYRPHYPPELFDFLAGEVPLRQVALDCATGNGQAAAELTRHFEQVIACDASVRQVSAAPALPRTRFLAACAEQLPLRTGSVDLITVAQGLHWFAWDRFYAEVRRLLRPHGLLAAWCYGLIRAEGEIDRLLDEFYHRKIGPFWPTERRHIDDHYAGIPFPFHHRFAPDFALRANWTLPQLLGYLGTWSGVQAYRTANQRDPLVELAANLRRAWPGDESLPQAIHWPLTLLLGDLT